MFEHAPVSPKVVKSRQILENSPDGMVTSALYSVSGIPRCSLSMTISLSSKSEIFSWFGDSNMKVMTSASYRSDRRVSVGENGGWGSARPRPSL